MQEKNITSEVKRRWTKSTRFADCARVGGKAGASAALAEEANRAEPSGPCTAEEKSGRKFGCLC
jgi:hypothetical protein